MKTYRFSFSWNRVAAKYEIKGPGLVYGDLSEKEEARAVIVCRMLDEVFAAGQCNKAAEVRRALIDCLGA